MKPSTVFSITHLSFTLLVFFFFLRKSFSSATEFYRIQWKKMQVRVHIPAALHTKPSHVFAALSHPSGMSISYTCCSGSRELNS